MLIKAFFKYLVTASLFILSLAGVVNQGVTYWLFAVPFIVLFICVCLLFYSQKTGFTVLGISALVLFYFSYNQSENPLIFPVLSKKIVSSECLYPVKKYAEYQLLTQKQYDVLNSVVSRDDDVTMICNLNHLPRKVINKRNWPVNDGLFLMLNVDGVDYLMSQSTLDIINMSSDLPELQIQAEWVSYLSGAMYWPAIPIIVATSIPSLYH
ncbi:hypothetical protein [Photobacterium leiognathi]|uniref:hypothetical protein n=1 Tax=Photobacterium leiognathi TaxID=553611 RepID=UPI002981985B|nr:hypothetical protein [Photobacterium leiognathi]